MDNNLKFDLQKNRFSYEKANTIEHKGDLIELNQVWDKRNSKFNSSNPFYSPKNAIKEYFKSKSLKYSNLRKELKRIQVSIIKESMKNKLKEDKTIRDNYIKYLKSSEHSRYKYNNNLFNNSFCKSSSIPPFDNYINNKFPENQGKIDRVFNNNKLIKSKLNLDSIESTNHDSFIPNQESPYNLLFQPPIKSLKKLQRLSRRCFDIKSRLNYIGKNSFINNAQDEIYTHHTNNMLLMENVQTPSKSCDIINRKICSVSKATPFQVKKKAKRTIHLNNKFNKLRIRKTLIGSSDNAHKMDYMKFYESNNLNQKDFNYKINQNDDNLTIPTNNRNYFDEQPYELIDKAVLGESNTELFPNFENIQLRCNLFEKGNNEQDLSFTEESQKKPLESSEIPQDHLSLDFDIYHEKNLTNSSFLNESENKLKWIDDIYSKNQFYKYSDDLQNKNLIYP